MSINAFPSSGGGVAGSGSAGTMTSAVVDLASIDTEYTLAGTGDTVAIKFWCRQNRDIRWALVTGKVASPTGIYHILKSGETFTITDLDGAFALYFATSALAGDNVEVLTLST